MFFTGFKFIGKAAYSALNNSESVLFVGPLNDRVLGHRGQSGTEEDVVDRYQNDLSSWDSFKFSSISSIAGILIMSLSLLTLTTFAFYKSSLEEGNPSSILDPNECIEMNFERTSSQGDLILYKFYQNGIAGSSGICTKSGHSTSSAASSSSGGDLYSSNFTMSASELIVSSSSTNVSIDGHCSGHQPSIPVRPKIFCFFENLANVYKFSKKQEIFGLR